jgi:hypothetical protein
LEKIMKVKKTNSKVGVKKGAKPGALIVEGLEEALARSKGENVAVRVTHKVGSRTSNIRRSGRMWLSQQQFAARFGFRLQHLETESAPTRVLLAIIAKPGGFKGDAARRRVLHGNAPCRPEQR